MKTQDSEVGIIDPDRLYTLPRFMQTLGVTKATLRAARRSGFTVRYVHKRAYVLGKDWIDYVVGSHLSKSQTAEAIGGQTDV